MSTLTYTLKRGYLQWVLDGTEISFCDLKESKYQMSVKEWGDIIHKANQEEDKHVSSSIIQVSGVIYAFQFQEVDKNYIFYSKLVQLKDAIPNVPFPDKGICYNMDKACGGVFDASDVLISLFEEWFGNKAAYPVEGKMETGSTDLKKVGYLNNPKKWDKDTKFGLKRIELLQRVIDNF
jgi:hypothetical protein